MRGYVIKRTGANIPQNLIHESTIGLSDKTILYASYLFFRKKDAAKYLNTFEYKEFFEVIGVTFDEPKKQ